MAMTIETVMSYEWKERIEPVGKGIVRLTVPPIRDFEIFGTEDEVRTEWREALQSHLIGYLAVGKQIPIPQVRVVEQKEENITRIKLDERLQPV